MSPDDETAKLVTFWLDKADAALASARAERSARRIDFAVNRAYYAASAALLHRGRTFTRHAGLRAAVHSELIKSGHVDPEWGRAFDRLFESRQRADYLAFGEFEQGEVEKLMADAAGFVSEMHALVRR